MIPFAAWGAAAPGFFRFYLHSFALPFLKKPER
jgi:hypothetical protein